MNDKVLKVLQYVSRGRGYVGVEPYPDSTAREVLGELRSSPSKAALRRAMISQHSEGGKVTAESEERRLLREAYRILKRHYHAPALRREIDALLGKTTAAGQDASTRKDEGRIAEVDMSERNGTLKARSAPSEVGASEPASIVSALSATSVKTSGASRPAPAAAIERERLANMRADQAEEARDAALRPDVD